MKAKLILCTPTILLSLDLMSNMPVYIGENYKEYTPAEMINSEKSSCSNPPPLKNIATLGHKGRWVVLDVECSKKQRCPTVAGDCPFKRHHAI